MEEDFNTWVSYNVDDLARIFYTLRGARFGHDPFRMKAALATYFKQGKFKVCFEKLSVSLQSWSQEGMPVIPGDYFKALFDVFGENTYASHVIAECGLPIYQNSLVNKIKSEPILTEEQQSDFHEARISDLMDLWSLSREDVLLLMRDFLSN